MAAGEPTTILFWNLNGKSLETPVVRAAAEYGASTLVLAEANIHLNWTDALGPSGFREVFHTCPVLRVFTNAGARAEALRSTARWSIFGVTPAGGGGAFVLAAAHLPSKMGRDPHDQTEVCRRFAADIADAERVWGDDATAVVGDLNADPFEPGILGAVGLHGLMTRPLARRAPRLIDGGRYPVFYNPMWGRFGDTTPGPPGSYFYEKSGHFRQSWHLFDQVLVRPALLPRFRDESLRVLDRVGEERLLDAAGEPDTRRYSDHLPLVFSVEAPAAR